MPHSTRTFGPLKPLKLPLNVVIADATSGVYDVQKRAYAGTPPMRRTPVAFASDRPRQTVLGRDASEIGRKSVATWISAVPTGVQVAGLGLPGDDPAQKAQQAARLMEQMVDTGISLLADATRATVSIKDDSVRRTLASNIDVSITRLKKQRGLISSVLAGKTDYAVWYDVVYGSIDQAYITFESRSGLLARIGLAGLGAGVEPTLLDKLLAAFRKVLAFIVEAGKVVAGLVRDVVGAIVGGVAGGLTKPLLIVAGVAVVALFVLPKILNTGAGKALARRL